jgi:hypothetical protein
MKRGRSFRTFALAGLVVGLLLLPIRIALSSRADWRATEIAEWCNSYRANAQVDQDLVRLHASRQTLADRMAVEYVAFRTAAARPWFARCATRKISASAANPEKVDLLLAHLQEVIQAIPIRNPSSPDDYPAPLEDPAQLGFSF